MKSFVAAFLLLINFLRIFCHNFDGGRNKTVEIKDHFASPGNLTLWAAIEYEIYKTFKSYYKKGTYDKEPMSKSVLKRYFADYEDSNGLNGKSKRENDIFSVANDVSSNPIMVYRMLRRINKYEIIIAAFGSKTSEIFDGEISNIWELLEINKKSIPTENDVIEAMESILRLHHIYDLNITEFSSGVIAGINTNTRLEAVHCYEIGVYASIIDYYDLSIEWLELAYSKVMFHSDVTLKQHTIKHALLESIIEHDAALVSIAPWVPTIFNESVWRNYVAPNKYGSSNNRTKRKTVQYEAWKGKKQSNYNDVNFWGLCSGKNFQTEKEKSQLYCWRDSGKDNVNVLSPSKVEQLSKYPYILQIYDAIGLKICDRIVMRAESGLKRSEVLDYDSAAVGSKLSKVRTSANAWLFTDNNTKDLIKIERRIQSITGLKADGDASEALQVATYVFGRHYDVHTDTLKEAKLIAGTGDRIATFMIYMDEPLAGGFTAFVQAGIAAKPVKGSAVFWYNMYKDGSSQDDITWHGACPVILGNKVVANKWIRYEPQFLALPCSLNQNDTSVGI